MRTTTLFVSIFLLTITLNIYLQGQAYAEPQVGRWEAVEALSRAQEAVKSAYRAIVKAEESGAPVDGLVDRLNQAISITDLANKEVSRGNYEAAYRNADEASALSDEIVRDAELLVQDAHKRMIQNLIIIPLVALVAAVSSFFGLKRWRKYKRDRLFQMEIKEVRDEK